MSEDEQTPPALPSRDDILSFIKSSEGKITKREIARAFGIRGPDKVHLKKLLKTMAQEGLLAEDHARALRPSDRLPAVLVVEFAGLDRSGETLLRPAEAHLREHIDAVIRLVPDGRGRSRGRANRPSQALGPGDRALVRLTPVGRDAKPTYKARIMKRLEAAERTLLGIYHGGPEGGRIVPVDRKQRHDYRVRIEDTAGSADGELVEGETLPVSRNRLGPRAARITRRLGDMSAPRSISLIAIHRHEIPVDFPQAALQQAERARQPGLKDRVDLRSVPLITIDPADARDHDDAVFAEPDDDAGNPGGWHAIVAIADVSHFVTPASALDKAARERGNSCYFPDRVVPMLPERLSTDLCSLKPGEERPVLAAHLWFSADGRLKRHRFERAVMKSHANLAYERVQHVLDGGKGDREAESLLVPVLRPLHALFTAIMTARAAREPLDLDLPERRIELNEAGEVKAIRLRERLDAHRIVEELMISANVAAAEALERARTPLLYRVHEEPPLTKLEALRDMLKGVDGNLSLAKGTVMAPRLFNGILRQVAGQPEADQVNEMILRSQTQAYYSPDNLGHFGLALPRYAHFTSPIRRYADLVVHRALVKALGLGTGGLSDDEAGRLTEIGEHISNTERRAMAAERDANDRYIAAYLGDAVGDIFTGRVSGVTRFGLFVELMPSGGSGLLPIRDLGSEYFSFDERRQWLEGERSGTRYKLGDRLDVRLVEANRYTGSVRLALAESGDESHRRSRKSGSKGTGSSKGTGAGRAKKGIGGAGRAKKGTGGAGGAGGAGKRPTKSRA